jgi:hypothetical protein
MGNLGRHNACPSDSNIVSSRCAELAAKGVQFKQWPVFRGVKARAPDASSTCCRNVLAAIMYWRCSSASHESIRVHHTRHIEGGFVWRQQSSWALL